MIFMLIVIYRSNKYLPAISQKIRTSAFSLYVYIYIKTVMYTSLLCIAVKLRALLQLDRTSETYSRTLHNKRCFGNASKMTDHRRCQILVSGFSLRNSGMIHRRPPLRAVN